MSPPLAAITGGAGHLAQYVAEGLTDLFELRLLDKRKVEDERPGEPLVVDLMNLDETVRAVDGANVVVHLGAIPHPKNDPPEIVYGVNVMSTFHVLEACKKTGVSRLIMASSDSTLGFVFRERNFSPAYLPIDENHPLRPQDPYGLSKWVGEITCKSFTEATGLKTLCLRFCHVWFTKDPEPYRGIIDNPEPGAHNLWSYVDARDAAQAIRLACLANDADHAVLFVTAPDAATREDSRDLVRRFYPNVQEVRPSLKATSSLIQSHQAEKILGYIPQHSWREFFG